MLGNKCAGKHYLKTNIFYRDKLFQAIFGMVISNMCVFLQHSIYHRTAVAAVSSSVAMVGMTPYKLSLKVPWVNRQLVGSDFTYRKR